MRGVELLDTVGIKGFAGNMSEFVSELLPKRDRLIYLYVAHEKREYIPQGSEACTLLFFQHAPDRAAADAQAFRSPGLIHFLCQVHSVHDLAVDLIQAAAQINGVACCGEYAATSL